MRRAALFLFILLSMVSFGCSDLAEDEKQESNGEQNLEKNYDRDSSDGIDEKEQQDETVSPDETEESDGKENDKEKSDPEESDGEDSEPDEEDDEEKESEGSENDDDGEEKESEGFENDDDAGTVPESDADQNMEQPLCVWFQAYQENFEADSVNDILNQAENCYVLIDPFDSTASRSAIAEMKQKGNIVGCYISSGTCENWRDDYDEMKPHCVEKAWGEWAGEYFVDKPNDVLIEIMKKRIDKMASWGCDMVEFDNMDFSFDPEYKQKYGFSATPSDGIVYNQTLCDYTHDKQMKCMAKNTRRGAEDFDGGTFESYNNDKNWWETEYLKGFLNDSKPGIVVHYNETGCDSVYDWYREKYGEKLSYICEDRSKKKYVHYNQGE